MPVIRDRLGCLCIGFLVLVFILCNGMNLKGDEDNQLAG